MDEITVQALTNMTSVLQSFLPTAMTGVSQELLLIPKKVKPTGIGGYVGENTTPQGSLLGRQIQAVSEIMLVSSSGLADLHQATGSITRTLLSQDRNSLRSNGIFTIDYEEMSTISHSGSGGNTTDSRSINFTILFEYIPQPTVTESIIDSIEYNLEAALASGKASFFRLNFSDQHAAGQNPLDSFDFVDDPDINATSVPGNWSFNVAEGSLHQDQSVRGGGATLATARKAGTQALLLDDGRDYLTRDMIIKADLLSHDEDHIGLIFRLQDENNFYFYLMSARHGYHFIGKKIGGSFSFLDHGGINQNRGFQTSQNIQTKLRIENTIFQVYMNGEFILSGSDSSISAPGRLGFLCHRNQDAHFFSIQIIKFSTEK